MADDDDEDNPAATAAIPASASAGRGPSLARSEQPLGEFTLSAATVAQFHASVADHHTRCGISGPLGTREEPAGVMLNLLLAAPTGAPQASAASLPHAKHIRSISSPPQYFVV